MAIRMTITSANSTNSDDSTDASNSDSSSIPVDNYESLFQAAGTYIAPPPNPWGSDPFGPDLPDKEKKVEDTPELTPEQIAEAKRKHFKEKRELQRSFLTVKRTVFLQNVTITNNDILIGLSPSFRIYHTDLEDGIKMYDAKIKVAL